MPLRSITRWLLVLALALPVIQAVLVWVRTLLVGMRDDVGARIIAGIGSTCLALWAVTLVGLLIVLAIGSLSEECRERSGQDRGTDGH